MFRANWGFPMTEQTAWVGVRDEHSLWRGVGAGSYRGRYAVARAGAVRTRKVHGRLMASAADLERLARGRALKLTRVTLPDGLDPVAAAGARQLAVLETQAAHVRAELQVLAEQAVESEQGLALANQLRAVVRAKYTITWDGPAQCWRAGLQAETGGDDGGE